MLVERAERTEAHGRRRTFSSPEIPDRRISLVQDAPLIQRTFFRRRKQNKKKQTNKQPAPFLIRSSAVFLFLESWFLEIIQTWSREGCSLWLCWPTAVRQHRRRSDDQVEGPKCERLLSAPRTATVLYRQNTRRKSRRRFALQSQTLTNSIYLQHLTVKDSQQQIKKKNRWRKC